MRINSYIAQATGMSRRAADQAIAEGRVEINAQPAHVGQQVESSDEVWLDKQSIPTATMTQTIALNKPVGYVCSRAGQGSQTIYDLLPPVLHHLKPVGRLDKDSSGLLLLTNDGKLAHQLTHPSFQKEKVYQVGLDKPLSALDEAKIRRGVNLNDGLSRLAIRPNGSNSYEICMSEGRNRQIRRTFAKLGYKVAQLHRVQFGNYLLGDLESGKIKTS